MKFEMSIEEFKQLIDTILANEQIEKFEKVEKDIKEIKKALKEFVKGYNGGGYCD